VAGDKAALLGRQRPELKQGSESVRQGYKPNLWLGLGLKEARKGRSSSWWWRQWGRWDWRGGVNGGSCWFE